MSNNGAAIEETKPHHGTRRTEEPYARGRLDVLAPDPETVSTEGPLDLSRGGGGRLSRVQAAGVDGMAVLAQTR